MSNAYVADEKPFSDWVPLVRLSDAEESNKAVERALKDVDYRGTYADGVLYLKQQLASLAKERDEIAAQARMLDRMVDERDEQLAAALAACEAIRGDVSRCYKMLLSEPDTKGALFKAENILRDAVSIKPDASALRQHDEALIERCAEVCEEYQGSAETCAAAIRELKGEGDLHVL